jgi:hypothetical protein
MKRKVRGRNMMVERLSPAAIAWKKRRIGKPDGLCGSQYEKNIGCADRKINSLKTMQ